MDPKLVFALAPNFTGGKAWLSLCSEMLTHQIRCGILIHCETNGGRRMIPHSSRTFELLGGISRVSRSNLAQENRQKQCAKGTDRREGNVDGWRRPYWV